MGAGMTIGFLSMEAHWSSSLQNGVGLQAWAGNEREY